LCLAVLAVCLVAAGCSAPQAQPTVTITVTQSATPKNTATVTLTPKKTNTPTPENTITPLPTPSSTPPDDAFLEIYGVPLPEDRKMVTIQQPDMDTLGKVMEWISEEEEYWRYHSRDEDSIFSFYSYEVEALRQAISKDLESFEPNGPPQAMGYLDSFPKK
jgi:hypothetical protein